MQIRHVFIDWETVLDLTGIGNQNTDVSQATPNIDNLKKHK